MQVVMTQNHVSVRRYLRYTTPNHDSAAPEDSRQLSLIDAGAASWLLSSLRVRGLRATRAWRWRSGRWRGRRE